MCGLISFAGRENFNIDKIKLLFILNESRGKDSCGIYVKDKGIVKIEGEATKAFLPYVDIKQSTLLLGHVRQGTIGTKNKENSHPFREDNLIQIHNGRIDNHLALAKEYEIAIADYNVDSHLMLKVFKYHYDKDPLTYVEKGLQAVNGPIALMMYDTNHPDSVIFYRNTERPLFYGQISEGNYYFSSIQEALMIIGIPKDDIVDAPKDMIHTLNTRTNLIESVPFVKIIKPTVVLPTRTLPAFVSTSSPQSVIEKMLMIYNRVENKKPVVVASLKNKTIVEFDNEKGENETGEIIANCHPHNDIYVIKTANGSTHFIKSSLLTEIAEEDEVTFKELNTGSYITAMITTDDEKIEKVGRITYIQSKDDICIDINLGKNKVDFEQISFDQITGWASADMWEESSSYKVCITCRNEMFIGEMACPDCNALEIIPNDNGFNYEDYDNAYSLYTELESQPGFYADATIAQISEEDVFLAQKISNTKAELNDLDDRDDTIRKELLTQITGMMDRRSTLLENLITLAKQQEEYGSDE